MTGTASAWTPHALASATAIPTLPPTVADLTATLQALHVAQTAAAWDLTATALWWTPTPTQTIPPTWTSLPTNTPAAIAGLAGPDQPTGGLAGAEPEGGSPGGEGGVALLFLAGAVLVTVPLAAALARRALRRRAPAPLPGPMRPTLFKRHGDTHWITDARQSTLVAQGVLPRQAAAIVEGWGEPYEPAGTLTGSHVITYWRDVVLATLSERGMLRKDEPPAARALAAPDRVIYILEMTNLGGVRLEQWLDPNFAEQLRAASGGCRVVVTGEGGVAIQIGVEPESTPVPSPQPAPPPLPRLAPLDLATRPRPPYAMGIGVGRGGPIWAPLSSLGHVMVSGATGSGKSYFLRALAYQLISLPPRQAVTLYLADRAGNVFTPLDVYSVPQLAAPVAKTPEAVVELLNSAIAEMGRRERLYDAEVAHFPEKLSEYNAIPGVEPLPHAVVIVDEVTVLVTETGGQNGPVHQALLKLAAQGRKYGFTLIVAGQDFKATTFNTALTHQLSTRVAFKAGSANESRVVLGEDGAEKLRGEGHGLLRHGGRLVEFQGFYVDKAELIARCAAIGAPPSAPALSERERQLVQFAVDHLGGAFTKNKLAAAFADISGHAILKLAQEWEAQGLLVREARGDAIKPQWWVTPQLAAMARE